MDFLNYLSLKLIINTLMGKACFGLDQNNIEEESNSFEILD